MTDEPLDQQIEAARRRLEELWERSGLWAADQRRLAEPLLEELASAIEELHVAGEELRLQNEELATNAEDAQRERNRYRELFEFAPDGYVVTDLEGTIREANRAAAQLVGAPQDSLIGKPLVVFMADADRHTFHSHLAQLRQTNEIRDWALHLQPRVGTSFAVAIHGSAVHDLEGKSIGVRWLLQDVREQRQAEAREQAARTELQRKETTNLRAHGERMAGLEHMKSEFLKLASHELRGPLGVLRGYTSMMADGSLGVLPPQLEHVIPIILAKQAQMNRLINEMIETARLEDGRLQLKFVASDLRPIVEQAFRAIAPLASGRHRLKLDLPEDEVPVQVDRERIDMIVTNLLDNAIKFSPNGGDVLCEVTRTGSAGEVTVRDRGIGVAPEDMPQLFTRFGRIVTSDNSHISGTGLGLYLAREVAHMHAGEISVESKRGEGSTFTLSVPLGQH